MIRKEKKSRRKRGQNSRQGKRRRGAGNRGGRGRAGRGKKSAAQKFQKFYKELGPLGRFGIRGRALPKKIRAINIGRINEIAEDLLLKKTAKQEKEGISLDLKDIGYDKLLGSGSVNKKFIIKCMFASEGAKKKVQSAGGQVII